MFPSVPKLSRRSYLAALSVSGLGWFACGPEPVPDRRRELLRSWSDFLLARYAEFEEKLEALKEASRVLEESPDDLRKNMAGFGWDIEEWERQGKWAFVDADGRLKLSVTQLPGEARHPLVRAMVRNSGALRNCLA